MADSTTKLPLISSSQAAKEVTANAVFSAMSANALFGRNDLTSSGLIWNYIGGTFQKPDGTLLEIANGSITLTANATNYLYVDSVGVVKKATAVPAGWPAPLAADAIALYEIKCDASGINPAAWPTGGYRDLRAPLRGPSGPAGATGPAGPAGATGATGAPGAAGTNGTNGSVWRDGSGAPSNSLGANGDYYLNDANGDVYLKSGGIYSVVTNIKGASGTSVLTTKGDFLTYSTTPVRQPIGADGQLIIADSSQPTGWRWGAPATGGGSLGAIADAQIFSASGTWTKPANVNVVLVVCLGAGGGGGGGQGGAAGTARVGGTGGGGGCIASAMYRAVDLPANVSVTVGSGGTSGAGGSGGNGSAGGQGGNSSFGAFLFGYGGGGGCPGGGASNSGGSGGGSGGAGVTGSGINNAGGAPATAVSGAGIAGQGGGGAVQAAGKQAEYGGGAGGGTGNTSGGSGSGGSSIYGGPGGGGGGSITSTNVVASAGAGGGVASYTSGDGAAAGTGSAGANGVAGTAGDSTKCGTGGGGGAANTAGTGGAGGAGGVNGAGGGGGGGGTTTGGAGGAGGRGAVYVWSW